jgi:hypothetical protein
MTRTLTKLLTLKPYGNELIDGVAQIWLVLAALNIASIAFCDAIAWAYFGFTTTQGPAAWAVAAIAGLIVFMLVGSVDAMFVMHDRSDRRNARREALAVAARIVLVILTFTVTAPFLTQLFFARDIEAGIQRQNEQTIAAKRHPIAARLAARQNDLEKEIAGRGASGRYGRGPTAAAIETEIGALQSELRAFDQTPPEVLATRYGIDLVREGPDTRARVLAEMERSESFRATRLTIKAFLVFMFLGLLCLKLFQPESVRIYYSGRLQAARAAIDPAEYPRVPDMKPIRFAEWYEGDQRVRELTERVQTQENAVRVLQETLRNDIARMDEDLSGSAKNSDELEQQVASVEHDLVAVTARIAEDQQALDDFRYDELAGELALRDQQLLIASRARTVRKLAEHRAEAARLGTTLNRLRHRLETMRAYESQLRQSLSVARQEAAALTTGLQESRQRRVGEILRVE